MNETDARQVLLMRAVETAPADAHADTPLWRAEDAAWASGEARRRVGEGAAADVYLTSRAGLVLQRLRERDAAWRDQPVAVGLGASGVVLAWAGAVLCWGIVSNVLGPLQRINLLAPPVWGLVVWNLVVYAALLITASTRLRRRRPMPQVAPFWLRGLQRIAEFMPSRAGSAASVAVRRRHFSDWAAARAPVRAERAKAALHLAAAMLALGVVLSMYVFGLAFDFRAGWDSTWLDAPQVQRLLNGVFGPASALSGIDLPDAPTLARLRWAEGSSGERAARWIHLYAITLAALVIVPRLTLAVWSAWRARRAAERVALPLDEPYFRKLLREVPGTSRRLDILTYSYGLDADAQAGLRPALEEALGAGTEPRLVASLPLGAEDDLAHALPPHLGDALGLLFAATATPERETHGAIVRALAAARPAASLLVLVDESGLRRQFGAGADGLERLRQRRESWQRMLHSLSLPAPLFIDLAGDQRR